ncbi:MAG: helix-turn-helix transcriptional regulator [Salinibacter sp.]
MMTRARLDDDAKERLGAKIKESREEHGFTQQDLANELDVSLQTVQGWEQGRYAPSARAAKSALKKVLNIDVDTLIRSGKF